MNPIDFFLERVITRKYSEIAYSQCGEDLIVSWIINNLGITDITYLDIGANHPIRLNNTYYFYKKGYSGVLVEPEPSMYSKLKQFRPRDISLNVGVAFDKQKEASLFVNKFNVFSSFSEDFVKDFKKDTTEDLIEKVIRVQLININDIFFKYFVKAPTFVSIDVEGVDLDVLKTINFDKYRPTVFCIETITQGPRSKQKKIKSIFSFMKSKGYIVLADTFLNTIFVDSKVWK